MTPVIIDKVTRKYKGPASPANPTCDPSTEEIVYGVPPSGFKNDSVDRPSHDPVTGKWTGTLLLDYELSVYGYPVVKATAVTASLVASATSKITDEFNKRIAAVKTGYTQEEIDSWSKQEKEARDYVADPVNASVPLITGIASSRGLALADFAALVILKADAYAAIVGPLIGKKKFLIDALASKTDAQLEAYDAATEWGP